MPGPHGTLRRAGTAGPATSAGMAAAACRCGGFWPVGHN